MKVSITATRAERRQKAGLLLKQVAADLAPDNAIAKAVLDLLNDLEVDHGEKHAIRLRPLRELADKTKKIYQEQIAGALKAIVGAYEEGRIEKALTLQDLDRLLAIIRRRHAAAALRSYGPDALTAEEIQELERAGLGQLTKGGFKSIELAHRIGRQLVGDIPGKAPPAPSFAAVLTEYRKDDPELGAIELASIRAATERAGEYVRGIGEEAAEDLRSVVAAAIENRQSPSELRSALRQRSQDWGRDWERVANTELVNAVQAGQAEVIRARGGDDARVYKQVAPDACRWCRELHIAGDGRPRIFLLSELEANGTNVGRRKAEWRSVVGAIHPFCQCILVFLPSGWELDEEGDAVPIEKAIPVWFEPGHDRSSSHSELAANTIAKTPEKRRQRFASPMRDLINEDKTVKRRPRVLEVVPMLASGEHEVWAKPEIRTPDAEEKRDRRRTMKRRRRQLVAQQEEHQAQSHPDPAARNLIGDFEGRED